MAKEEEELDEYFYYPHTEWHEKRDAETNKKREEELDAALSIFGKKEDVKDNEDELSESEHMCEQCGLKESLCE